MTTTKKKRGSVRLSVGGSSILVIFVILTLTTFATLSLVSANADQKLSRKSMEASAEYYAADAAAEEKLAEIDAFLQAQGTADLDKAEIALSEYGSDLLLYRMGDRLFVGYNVPIKYGQEGEGSAAIQELQVRLEIVTGPERFIRRQWKVINTVEDEPEEGLNLWLDDEGFELADID